MDYCELKNSDIKGVYKDTMLIARQYALGDIARILQSVTEKAMDELGIGYYFLKAKNLIWVICFLDISIKRMSEEGEVMEIYSWPGKNRFGMYSRRYAMFSAEGECLITSTSLFSTVDKNTRKLISSAEVSIQFPVIEFTGEPALPDMKKKEIRTPFKQQHAVSIHEIDRNDHVNNSFYLDWSENLMGDSADIMAEKIKRVWINYAREIRMGETVVFQYGWDNDALFVKGMVGEDNCFKAQISV